MTQPQEQGASAARTAGQVAHDAYWQEPEGTAFWDVHPQQVRDGWERAAAAVQALASPADSAEMTAGEGSEWPHSSPNPTPKELASPQFEAIWQAIKTWDIGIPEEYGGYCGATGSHVVRILRALSSTPAPATPPGVPDSVREALGFYADPLNWRDTPSWDGDPVCITEKAIPVSKEEGSPCDCGDVARAALKALAAHQAGQSTGLGAGDGEFEASQAAGSIMPLEWTLKRLEMIQTSAQANRNVWLRNTVWNAIQWLGRLPAPDSIRTGPVGTEEVAQEAAKAMAEFEGLDWSEMPETADLRWQAARAGKSYWRNLARIAARPAAPEAQGASGKDDLRALRERAAQTLAACEIDQDVDLAQTGAQNAHYDAIDAIMKVLGFPAPPPSGQGGAET